MGFQVVLERTHIRVAQKFFAKCNAKGEKRLDFRPWRQGGAFAAQAGDMIGVEFVVKPFVVFAVVPVEFQRIFRFHAGAPYAVVVGIIVVPVMTREHIPILAEAFFFFFPGHGGAFRVEIR